MYFHHLFPMYLSICYEDTTVLEDYRVLMSIWSLTPLLNYVRETSVWVNYAYDPELKMPADLIHKWKPTNIGNNVPTWTSEEHKTFHLRAI